ncbi:MAG: energy transducer TonB [Gammaproteobacteria bacterium]|nr:energy transducer TonB [Gammaproteobacteria bacterium]
MSEAVYEFTNNDRIGLSFFSAFLVHMVIILGVTFALPKLADLSGMPSMEITLVQTKSDKAPDDANFLAQANQDGGGNSDSAKIARNPLPIQEIGDHNLSMPAHRATPQRKIKSEQEKKQLLTENQAEEKIKTQTSNPENREARMTPPNPGLVKSEEFFEERSRLNAEISRFWEEYQQRPKKKYINARTREYKYAAYMDAWRAKVERVGNLNYPEEARRKGLSGDLVLDVALKPDGSLDSIDIRRSSGHKLLDDAAVRIVTLAAPFSPFPKSIQAEADVLHITRTWKFNQEGWDREP